MAVKGVGCCGQEEITDEVRKAAGKIIEMGILTPDRNRK